MRTTLVWSMILAGQNPLAVSLLAALGIASTSIYLAHGGLSVGREHITAFVNTLVLAYAGASFPLFLLFAIQVDQPLWVTLNSEFVAEEIVRSLVGSLALVLAVPITTWMAAHLLRAGSEQPPFEPAAHLHFRG